MFRLPWSSTTSRTSSGPSRSNAGVAILPAPTLARELEAGTLVGLPIDGQNPRHRLTRPLAIIQRRSRQLSPTASRFLKLLTGESESDNPRPRSHGNDPENESENENEAEIALAGAGEDANSHVHD